MWRCAISPAAPTPARGTIRRRARKRRAWRSAIFLAPRMGHPNLGRWLTRIPNETLIVWGDKDRLMPASQAAAWAARFANARVNIVPDVGHFAMQEDPGTVTAIGDFLASWARTVKGGMS